MNFKDYLNDNFSNPYSPSKSSTESTPTTAVAGWGYQSLTANAAAGTITLVTSIGATEGTTGDELLSDEISIMD